MDRRLNLHEELCEFLGSRNVYFSPPESVKLKYPCIIYKLNDTSTRFADDRAYSIWKRYSMTYISPKPDSNVEEDLPNRFPLCTFDRFFTSDNLNHYSFNLYY
jgi:hypothetical protein